MLQKLFTLLLLFHKYYIENDGLPNIFMKNLELEFLI